MTLKILLNSFFKESLLSFLSLIFRIYSVPPPKCYLRPKLQNYMLLYSTLLCKKTARAPGGGWGCKNISPQSRGGGGGTE